MKVTVTNITLKFPFDKYCKLIFAIPPAEDLTGISEIKFVDQYSHSKADHDALARYFQGNKGLNAVIEIHLSNIFKRKIHEFTFKKYPEVAAMLLSQVIFHEIAHHVHTFRRRGVKKEKVEVFAAQYTAACYYRYLLSRKSKILEGYRRASRNNLQVDEEGRYSALNSEYEIMVWLEQNKEGVPFP